MGKPRTSTLVTVAIVAAFLGSMGAVVVMSKINEGQERCAIERQYLAERGAPKPLTHGAKKVYVIGDSYTAGDQLDDRDDAWVRDIPKSWQVVADGIGGTGFVNPGNCGDKAFSARLDPAKSADMVILQGGLNDWREQPAAIEAATTEVLKGLSGVPEVVVVGPVHAPSRSDESLKVDAALRAATEAEGRQYVSAIDWDLPYLPDKLHITPIGQSKFAELVGASIDG